MKKIIEFFIGRRKTDKELQAELGSIVGRIYLEQGVSFYTAQRYEDLLKEIYKRGLKPEHNIEYTRIK